MNGFKLAVIVHNIRSCHNVGSILRTADGIGIDKVYLSGYTPFPKLSGEDPRLPHEADKVHRQIDKTALGAQNFVDWKQEKSLEILVKNLRKEGFKIIAVEQTKDSHDLDNFSIPSDKIALVVGNEREGLSQKELKLCDETIEIPMKGRKESLNVSVAAGIVMHNLSAKGKMV